MEHTTETWDAKLSTSKRKKLKGSTFCGPGRSFPVPDCAHVTAARRLIGRAKVSSSTKAKILACVSRKAKSLGCGSSKKDELTEEQFEELVESEEFEPTLEVLAFLEADYADRDADLENLDVLKDSAAKVLDKLRSKQSGTSGSDERVEKYKARSLTSLLDSLLDELEEVASE